MKYLKHGSYLLLFIAGLIFCITGAVVLNHSDIGNAKFYIIIFYLIGVLYIFPFRGYKIIYGNNE